MKPFAEHYKLDIECLVENDTKIKTILDLIEKFKLVFF